MINVACLLYAVALVLLVREGARRLDERRFDVWFVVAGFALATAAWIALPAASIPIEFVTELHEGRSTRSIRALYARGAHSLQAHDLLLYWVSSADGVDVRDAVRLNLVLTGLAAWLVSLYAARLGGRWSVGAIAGGLFLASPPVLNAAVSSYGAPLGTVLVLLSVPSIERVSRSSTERRERAEAFLLVLALLTLASLTRKDWLLGTMLWVPCGLLSVWREAPWMPRLRALVARAWRPRAVRVGIILTLLLMNQLILNDQLAWIVAALQPLASEILFLPSVTSRLAVPLGVVALAVVGAVSAWRAGPAGWWASLVVAGMFKMFYSAGHGVAFEYLRYLCAWVAPALLLAAVGWRSLSEKLSERRLGGAVAVLVGLSLVSSPWLSSSVESVYGHDDPVWPLARDKQVEVRLLLAAHDAYPQCLFVSRVSKTDSGPPRSWQYLFFGEGLRQPLEVDEDPSAADPLQAAVSRVDFLRPRCVMVFRGLDCNIEGVDCSTVEEGLEPVAEWTLPRRLYSDTKEYGPWNEELRLGLYRFPLSALASNGMSAPP